MFDANRKWARGDMDNAVDANDDNNNDDDHHVYLAMMTS